MKGLKIATAAVVAASLPINLMVDFGYSPLSLEVLGLALSLATAVALVAALTANSFLYSYLLALLVSFFAEIYYFNWTPVQNVVSFVILFGSIFLLRATGARLLPYFLVFTALFSLSALLRPQQPVLTPAGDLPDGPGDLNQSLLHIVLDEMASPYAGRFPPAPGHPAESMLDDLAAEGLQVEAQAYAVSAQTVHSMSAIVALDPDRTDYEAFRPGAAMANRVAENRYMLVLAQQGYDISILQSNYLDYCAGLEDVNCQTYSRIGHVSSFSTAGIGERMKFAFVTMHEALRSNTRSGIQFYYFLTHLIEDSDPVLDSSVPLISYQLMQGEVMARAQAITPGEVHFIHLLVPHFPYAFDQDCERLPISEWRYPDRHTPQIDSARSYASYWDQVACVHNTLMDILRVTADKEFLTTIVHGDHGARIHWLTEAATRDDNLKTFLAVRAADLQPGVNTGPVGLQEAVIKVLEQFMEKAPVRMPQ